MRLSPAFALLAMLALGACGGTTQMPAAGSDPTPAELRSGDLTVRATALPTAALNDAMARQYGVERDGDSVLLVIGLRRGQEVNETSASGRISATATDLLGNRQQITLREVRNAGFIDYIGTAQVSMPDTLRFEIKATTPGARSATLRFSRDFYP